MLFGVTAEELPQYMPNVIDVGSPFVSDRRLTAHVHWDIDRMCGLEIWRRAGGGWTRMTCRLGHDDTYSMEMDDEWKVECGIDSTNVEEEWNDGISVELIPLESVTSFLEALLTKGEDER